MNSSYPQIYTCCSIISAVRIHRYSSGFRLNKVTAGTPRHGFIIYKTDELKIQ